jgi:hypothetical protein
MSISPTDIVLIRANCFKEKKPEYIYDFYHEDSEFRKFFRDKEEYAAHFEDIFNGLKHCGLKIVSENTKNNLSEVKYIEYFVDKENNLLTYYCKSYLKKAADEWLILKEIKELTKG